MEVSNTTIGPGRSPQTDIILPESSPQSVLEPFTLRPLHTFNRGNVDRQHSHSQAEYDAERTDHVDDSIFARGPRRTSTLPNLPRRKAVDRIKHEDDGRVFGNPSRQSTSWTNASASFDETAPWDKKSILSLDGGGIRGYSALLILQELMKHIKTLEKNYRNASTGVEDPALSSYHPLLPYSRTGTGSRCSNGETSLATEVIDSSHWLPCHYFDYIAGTSTGGLIGIMLGRLRMNIDDCISDYEDLGSRVFGRKRWVHVRSPLWWPRDKYSHKALENVVKEVVDKRIPKVPQFPGGQNFASDENRCRTVVLAYQQIDDEDASKSFLESAYFFRTYKNYNQSENPKEKSTERNPGPAHDIPIWEVARATSAAPGYFKPPVIKGKEYLDGGFGTNNPCEEIYEEVRTMNNHAENCTSIILSVGTGKAKDLRRLRKASGLSRYINLINVAIKWASESEETHNRMVRRSRNRKNDAMRYVRFNVEDGIGRMKLDEWRARGPIRTMIGVRVGKIRSCRNRKQIKLEEKDPATDAHAGPGNRGNGSAAAIIHRASGQNGHAVGLEKPSIRTSSSGIAQGESTSIPRLLRPRNKTLDSIRKHTMAYLSDEEVQQELEEVAVLLVEGRRQRAAQDPQRWKKSCFGAWYKCKVQGCRRGESEYQLRGSLQAHLLDKHRNVYSKDRREQLDKALDEFEIVIQ